LFFWGTTAPTIFHPENKGGDGGVIREVKKVSGSDKTPEELEENQ